MNSTVKKNGIYTSTITGMSHEGNGIAKIDGFTLFIEGALLDEEVKIKVMKVNKNFGFGKLLEILKPSKDRQSPVCKVSNRCGGCQLHHMSYTQQLDFKTEKVKSTLERIGKLENILVKDAIGMEQPFRYRNKVQYPVGEKDGKAIIGFYAGRSHEIVQTPECIIQDKDSEEIARFIIDLINKYKVPVYNEKSGKGQIRHIVTRIGFRTNEIMLILVTNGKKLSNKDILIKNVTEKFPNIKSVIQNVNTKNTNVILGNENITLFGEGFITDNIGDLKFEISPLSFYQVNPVQTEVLYNKALEYAGLTGDETVFDAYCGIGTISLFLAQKAKKVYGIEIIEQAIENAKENAKINGIENVEFLVGESEKIIPDLYKKGVSADVMVVDPPRKGCDQKLLDTIISMKPKRMVYVSCDVGTLARDLKYLNENGFKVIEVQPVDMFPYTHHVETVVKLTRNELTK